MYVHLVAVEATSLMSMAMLPSHSLLDFFFPAMITSFPECYNPKTQNAKN